MKSKRHLTLGIFVVAGVLLIGGALAVLGARTAFRDRILVESYFDEPVTGLQIGSPVRFRGVQVGEVDKITIVGREYPNTQHNYALVRVAVFPELLAIPEGQTAAELTRQRVQEGMRIQLRTANIAGLADLAAVYVPEAERRTDELKIDWEPKHLYMPSTKSTLLNLTNSLEKIMKNLEKTDIQGLVADVRATVDPLRKGLAQMDLVTLGANINRMSKSAADTTESLGGRVDRLLDKAKIIADNLDATITELRTSSKGTLASAKHAFARMQLTLERPELLQAMKNFNQLSKNANDAVGSIQALVADTNRSVTGLHRELVGRSGKLPATLGGLQDLTKNLDRLVSTLQSHPSLALFGEQPKPARKAPRSAR